MKANALGIAVLLIGAGIAFVAYAACNQQVKNVDSDDASSNPSCTDSNTTAACTYNLNDPSVPECFDGGSGVCSTTNTITYTKTEYQGKCNGAGGCGKGTRTSTPPSTNNTANAYFLSTCGG